MNRFVIVNYPMFHLLLLTLVILFVVDLLEASFNKSILASFSPRMRELPFT